MASLFASLPPGQISLSPELEVTTKRYTEQPISCKEAFEMGSHMMDTLLVIIVGQVDVIPDG
jgi:hypothetical protein